MITELKQKTICEDKRERWHKVYFYLPRTIEIKGKIYRVHKEWLWRKGTLNWFWDISDWDWEYSFSKPKVKDNG